MKTNRKKKTAIISIGLVMLLFSSCTYFWDVVIPTYDTGNPIPIASVIRNGVRTNSYTSDPPIYMETNDPDEVFFVMGAIMDLGGAHEVITYREVEIDCSSGKLGNRLYYTLIPLVETMEGEPGDTVSNGIWTVDPVTPGDWENSCPAGYVLNWVEYSWEIVGEDFHGNVCAPREGGTLHYEP